MGNSGPNKSRISLREQMDIAAFLRDPQVLKMIEEGVCMYVAGWNDDKVAVHFANVFGHALTRHNVAGVREQLFGKLSVPVRNVDQGELQLKYDNALERISVLEKKLNDYEIRLGKVELKLKLER